MRNAAWALALAAVVALASTATAREKGAKDKKAGKGGGTKVEGALTAAAVAGDEITWTVSAADGEKTFSMAATVVVMVAEKNGQKQARMIRAAGKKDPKAKGNMTIVKGTFVSLAVQGNAATLTVKTDDGDQALPMGTKVAVSARERKGKTIAQAITVSAGKGKGGGKGKKKKEK